MAADDRSPGGREELGRRPYGVRRGYVRFMTLAMAVVVVAAVVWVVLRAALGG